MTYALATAPGKAVLSGEYAVLIGAPAVVIALDRRAVVQLKTSTDSRHSVSTPGFAQGSYSFSLGANGEILWQGTPPKNGLPLVEAAFSTVKIANLSASSFSIDTRAFADETTNKKLGLGSSAAAMTALIAVLCQLDRQNRELASAAFAEHSVLQNGLGSGVDVAASLSGGVIEYCRDNAAKVIAHSWPENLHYSVLWSGRPASTHERVAKFDRSNLNESSVDALVTAAGDFAREWARQNAAEIDSVLGDYTECLHDFDNANALGIFTAGHDLLYARSKQTDVRYKPCGAGGGDIGIAVSLNQTALKRFVTDAEKMGFEELSVAIDWNGVEVSQANDSA